jgi:hypothetical protein
MVNQQCNYNANLYSQQDALNRLLGCLDGVVNRGSGKYMARCPAHDDKSPSLSIKETSDGTILIRCFAGCTIHEIVSAVGMEVYDLFPDNGDYYQSSQKPRHNYKDLLLCLARESMFIYMVADALSKGETLCEHDQQRLLQVVTKINQIQEVARHG